MRFITDESVPLISELNNSRGLRVAFVFVLLLIAALGGWIAAEDAAIERFTAREAALQAACRPADGGDR